MKIYLAASGDSRLSANQNCWPAQKQMESELESAIRALGHELVRAHPYNDQEKHGFICSQREGLNVFASIPKDAPVIIAISVWQYSHHVYPGLLSHEGPVLTLANWSGQWPGLVGLLNLNGCLFKAGRSYSTLWHEDLGSDDFRKRIREWIDRGTIQHATPHVRPFDSAQADPKALALASDLAREIREKKAILGVFDEGCMGMYNAIIPDEMLHHLGVFKERLSQSALLFEMSQVPEQEARAVYNWLLEKGMKFRTGPNPATDLTEEQILQQCRMYVAACRIGDLHGCDAIGIQYQQGLKDMCPASDLVEGLLNNSDRPPVADASGKIIREGRPFTHFNEVDECAGLDGLFTERVHRALGQPSENTLHDLRWADWDKSGSTKEYVWVFEISGAAPAAHHIGGYAGSSGERQPPMYFPNGGSTLKGIARPGDIVWSRIYVTPQGLAMDLGRGRVLSLPEGETKRRWEATTSQWPIMHAVLNGVSRDQMMARHKSNHIQVAYANSAREADFCLQAKAALAHALGIQVFLCGGTDSLEK